MANKQGDNNVVHIGDRIVGSNNTQLQFSFETFNITKLSITLESSGGSFASQNVTVDVSEDNSNWVNLSSSGFTLPSGGGAVLHTKRYLAADTTTPPPVNLLDFQYVRFTVPALGGGISCIFTYGGKP